MRFNYATFKQRTSRVTKPALLIFIISIVAFSAILAYGATKRFKVTTDLELIVCEPDGKGSWKPLDRLSATASFDASLAELAYSKQYQTNAVWTPTPSEKGCLISVRQSRPVKESWNHATGEYKLELPIEAKVNGKTVNLILNATSETVQTPLGSISGQRAKLVNGTLHAGLIGVASFRANRNLFKCSGGSSSDQQNGSSSNKREEEFRLIVKGKGTAAPLN